MMSVGTRYRGDICFLLDLHCDIDRLRIEIEVTSLYDIWAVLWVLICTVHLTVCFYHVTYAFQSESTLYSCLNVKELLARSRREIWRWSDCNWIRTHNHLVHKRTLNHLAIWPAWLNGWVFVYELSGCGFESSCSHFTFRFRACFEQGVPWHSGNYRVWIHSETRTWHDKNIQLYDIFFQHHIDVVAIT